MLTGGGREVGVNSDEEVMSMGFYRSPFCGLAVGWAAFIGLPKVTAKKAN
jgi:hypothetical protein